MAQPKKKGNSARPQSQRAKARSSRASRSLFDSINDWMGKRNKALFYFIAAVCLLFSFLLFHARISEGGDDSAYIMRAYNFIHHHQFPSYQGPLYPMFLSLIMVIFGLKLMLLKCFSVLFNLLSLVFLYKAFKNRIPNFILYPVLFATAINAYFLYFASQTYSEAFFLFLQSLFFFYFFRLLDKLAEDDESLSKTYKSWLVVGLFIFLLTLARSIAFAIIPAVVLFFVFRKQYRYALYGFLSFLVFKIPFAIIKGLIWGSSAQFSSQGAMLLQKDPYDPSKGMETIGGFFDRFFGNINIYFSKRFFQIIGFRSDDAKKLSVGLAFLVVVLLIWGLYRIIKSKNKSLLFTAIYIACMIGVSFFALQTRWDQPRIVMIYVPMMLFVMLFGLYHLMEKASSPAQTILLYLMLGIILAGVVATTQKVKKNIPVLSQNLKGNIYYGYTPDWVNFLKMSAWCGKNLPKDALIASRKAPMSFIYSGGHEFFPVYRPYTTNPDSVLAFFKRNKVDYVILAHLRRNPKRADGYIINTMYRMMQPVAKKYPHKLKLIRQEGTSEQAYLYQILY